MNILMYRSDAGLSFCARAFLATGTRENDEFNRSLLKKNQTGRWIVATGRVRPGDAFFVLLPNVASKDGYPRELYAGVVRRVKPVKDRTVFTVKKFLKLLDVESEVKKFLGGRVPPMGNRVLQIWSSYAENDDLGEKFAWAVRKSTKDSSARRRSRLARAPRLPSRVAVMTEVFVRNPDVVAEVLDQANGVCSRCKNCAPFTKKRDGSPYLEVHHKVQLADDGEDTVENAIALCPNCHRELHHG